VTDTLSTQGFTQVVVEADGAQASQLMPLAVINYPAQEVTAQQGIIQAVSSVDDEVKVQQVIVMAVVRGFPDWPVARAWTYTLDGHDYYILNTIEETLVCDLSMDPPSWFVWGSGDDKRWRGFVGRQWVARLLNEENYGSNVLVGDRVNGVLYFLNPEAAADDNSDFAVDTVVPFRRVITGQVVVRGRTAISCPGVELTGSPPQLYNTSLNTVELFTSDDRGASYISCGEIEVIQDDYAQRLDWLSLGSMESPGRLFQIVDYGALTRVDDLVMPDAES
jgi:hypothetical protein